MTLTALNNFILKHFYCVKPVIQRQRLIYLKTETSRLQVGYKPKSECTYCTSYYVIIIVLLNYVTIDDVGMETDFGPPWTPESQESNMPFESTPTIRGRD